MPNRSNQTSRREWMAGLASASALAASGALVPHSAGAVDHPRRPNILLVMADDLGMECLGCYGGESYATPNLDRLAAQGLRFDNAFSTPVCTPSRVCLLTGRYSFRNYAGWGAIPDDEITLAQTLREAGYATAAAGKWQLALLGERPSHPRDMGFDEWCFWGWHEGSRYYDPFIWRNGEVVRGIEDRYGPEVYSDFLIDFMRRNRNRPFLAYYPMTLTHFPKTGGPYKEPPGPDGEHKTFAEMVEAMDGIAGKLTAALDELGLAENTVVLFTGDNGTPKRVTSVMNGREVPGGKGELTDAGTRVPLIARRPGWIPAGLACEDLIDFSDFMPTLADLARTRPPADRAIDGRSFAPRLRGLPGAPREWVHTSWEGRAWVRNQRWKLYENGQLFDMELDPLEANPLAPGEERALGARHRQQFEAVFESFA